MQDLLDSCKIDPITLRYFIKYEVLQKKPVFDSYKNFCQTLGDDTMSYQEFEFWFWRFYSGSLDVDYDKSNNRKPLELLQLPLEMVGKVVQKMDWDDRVKIRCVSKVTRAIADNEKFKMKTIRLFKTDCRLCLTLNENRFTYQQTTGKKDLVIQTSEPRKADRKVENEDFVMYALNNLKEIMKNPKLELENLMIEENGGYWHEQEKFSDKTIQVLTEISNSSNVKFHVKQFYVKTVKLEHAVPLLSLLKPGILEKIVLIDIDYDREALDAITRTCQWQKAKGVDLRTFSGLDPSEIEKCAHFEEFEISINSVSSDIVVQLKEMLLQSISFKKCGVFIRSDIAFTINDISVAFGLPIQDKAVHVPIPGSKDCLVFKLSFRYINIKRKHV